jgi:hypothetical protein
MSTDPDAVSAAPAAGQETELTETMVAPSPQTPERPRDRVRWLHMVETGSLDVFEFFQTTQGLRLPEFSARKKRAWQDLLRIMDWLDAADALAPDLVAAIMKRMRSRQK